MATPNAYTKAQNGAVALAMRDLERVWRSLDLSDPYAAARVMEGVWSELIGTYGEVTATLAADQFEDLTGMPAVMVRPVDPERAEARMRWAVGPLFDGDGDAWARLALLVDELVKQPGRSTMISSAREHDIRYARVPVGDTCSFCLMLASRGAVYESASTAGDGRKFHGSCDCRVEPIADEADLERLKSEGYDPEALYHEWMKANPYQAAPNQSAAMSRLLKAIEGRGDLVGFDGFEGVAFNARAVDETAETLAELLERYPDVNVSAIIHGTADTFDEAFGRHTTTAEAEAFFKATDGRLELHFRAAQLEYFVESSPVRPGNVRDAYTFNQRSRNASTVIHEFGHALEYTHQAELAPRRLAEKASFSGTPIKEMPRTTGRAFPEFCLEQGVNGYGDMMALLESIDTTRYGRSNAAEAFAESFVDWTLNGDDSGGFARWIGRKLSESGVVAP